MTSKSPSPYFARSLATAVQARRTWQALLLVLVVAVCYLALTPRPPKEVDFGWDKLNHSAAFAALALAGCLAFPGSRRTVLWVLLAMVALGGLIEVLQAFVPGRSSDWGDLLADSVGVVVGAVLARLALRRARRVQAPR